MDAVAIVPVKSFVAAKSRLEVPADVRRRICEVMLREVLDAANASSVSEVIVVSVEEEAVKIASELGIRSIRDDSEAGVNEAVSLADTDAAAHEASIVLPQDIPLVEPGDIDSALRAAPSPGALVVPSHKLDGTNALVRSPPGAFATHYDEDSYRIHMSTARQAGVPATLAFIRNMMIDVDTLEDLKYAISKSTKAGLADKLRGALG